MIQLAPSILAADFAKLAEDVTAAERGGAHLVHVDVMDGHFVPNISFGGAVMKSLAGKTKLPFDVHLMIESPERYIEDFVTDSTEYITVHHEACVHLHRTIQHIKSFGVKAGVSINPATSPSALEYVIDEADLILVMSVNPGFGGQVFIPRSIDKIKDVDEMRKRRGRDLKIEVDGGVSLENAGAVVSAGADIIVAGSTVFEAGKIEGNVRAFLEILQRDGIAHGQRSGDDCT